MLFLSPCHLDLATLTFETATPEGIFLPGAPPDGRAVTHVTMARTGPAPHAMKSHQE